MNESIAVVFIFDDKILDSLSPDDRRITFIHNSLEELRQKLEENNSTLIIRYGDPVKEIPELARKLKVRAVFTNRDYEPYAKLRDSKVKTLLEQDAIEFYSFKDHVIFEADEVKNQSGQYFKVFTPFSKAWRAKLSKSDISEAKVSLKNLLPKKDLENYSQKLSDIFKDGRFKRQELYLTAGRKGAVEQFNAFKKRIQDYKDKRDFPSIAGTSRISAHLRFGTLNVRELLRHSQGKDIGTFTWHNELIWREFYQMLLVGFPQLPEKCFQTKYDGLVWPGTRKHFEAWCEGQTGYPLIDATMRHFKRTGWVHNRLRMIVASFLTKDLLCDWKWGEQYFAKHLLDFELASNNGGWQWAASVGCDAQPYFRVFNPTLQSERFDPHAKFIVDEVPEIAKVPLKFIHAPWTAKTEELKTWGVALGKNYPHPIVVHATQKETAIKLFKEF